MSELDASSDPHTEDHSASKISLVRRQLPFLAILALAIGGVAYTNISQRLLGVFGDRDGSRMRRHPMV